MGISAAVCDSDDFVCDECGEEASVRFVFGAEEGRFYACVDCASALMGELASSVSDEDDASDLET